MGTLVFLVTFCCLLYLVVVVIISLFKKDIEQLKKNLLLISEIVVLYGVVLLLVSVTSKNTLLPKGKDKCFDEWCAQIVSITKLAKENANDYEVTLKISNKGGRAQKPDHPHIYVIDDQNRIYEGITKQRLINSKLDPHSSFVTSLLFHLPLHTKGSVVITEGGFPTQLIIGDEGSYLHKKSMTQLN